MIKELLKDVAKYLPSYIIPGIVGIVAIPVITHLFTPAEYGNYALVLVTVSVLASIAVVWIGSSIVRFFPAYSSDEPLEELGGTTIKLTLISVVAVCLISLGILFLVRDRMSPNLYFLMNIGILLFIARSGYQVLLHFLRAKRQVNWYSSFTIWRGVAGLGLGVALVMGLGLGVEGLLWGTLLGIAIALPWLWKVALGRVSLRAGRVISPLAWQMARYGFPIMIVGIASWILSLSDRYIIEFFRGSQEVGIYSASYVITDQSIGVILSLFLLAGNPIAFSIWEKQGEAATGQFVNRLTRYYLMIALPAAVGISVLAKPVVSVLTATDYHPGYVIVPLVAFGLFLAGITNMFGIGLACHKRTDLMMYCVLGSAILNVVLNLLFIPQYGYLAAAVTTLAAYAVNLTFIIIISSRFFVWSFPFKSLVRIAVASAVMGAVAQFLGSSLTSSTLINLITGIVVGVIVYALILFLLRELQEEEIQELHLLRMRILRKLKR